MKVSAFLAVCIFGLTLAESTSLKKESTERLLTSEKAATQIDLKPILGSYDPFVYLPDVSVDVSKFNLHGTSGVLKVKKLEIGGFSVGHADLQLGLTKVQVELNIDEIALKAAYDSKLNLFDTLKLMDVGELKIALEKLHFKADLKIDFGGSMDLPITFTVDNTNFPMELTGGLGVHITGLLGDEDKSQMIADEIKGIAELLINQFIKPLVKPVQFIETILNTLSFYFDLTARKLLG